MFVIEASPDSAVHRACSRIANGLVFVIRPLCRSADDRDVALCEAYAIAREEIEKLRAAASPARKTRRATGTPGRPFGSRRG